MKILFSSKSSVLFGHREHSHTCYEIAFTLSGYGITYAGGQEFDVKPGSIIIIPPNVLHSHKSESSFSNIFIKIDNVKNNTKTAVSYLDNTGFLINIANTIHLNFLQKEYNYESINQKFIEIVFEYIERLSGKSYHYEFVRKLKDVITQNFEDPLFKIPLEVKKMGISFDYMRHCFKEETGMTPLEYLTQIRIEQAKYYLQNSSVYSIGEIANMCGFSDQYYFSRVFKKSLGCSPYDYKRIYEKH